MPRERTFTSSSCSPRVRGCRMIGAGPRRDEVVGEPIEHFPRGLRRLGEQEKERCTSSHVTGVTSLLASTLRLRILCFALALRALNAHGAPLVPVQKAIVRRHGSCRVCDRLKIPRPARGYWAQFNVGGNSGSPRCARPSSLPSCRTNQRSWRARADNDAARGGS